MFKHKAVLVGMLLMGVIFFPVNLWSACTGSSPTWTATADISSLNTCISNASNGDRINVGAGTITSGINLPNTKQIKLVGAGYTQSTLTGGVTAYCSAGKGHAISGFTLQGGGIDVEGVCNNIYIYNNKFLNITSGPAVYFNADYRGEGDVLGLVNNNIFSSTASNYVGVNHRGAIDMSSPTLGSGNAVFIDNNTFSAASVNEGSGAVDANRGGRVVFRYNNVTNWPIIVHGGYQMDWTGVPAQGTALFEVYNNTIRGTGIYRAINDQGAKESIKFGNVMTGTITVPIGLLHYRSCCDGVIGCAISFRCDGDYSLDGNRSGGKGYPCFEQPGRGIGLSLSPHYIWNNTYNGSVVGENLLEFSGCSNPSSADHIVQNRDYYNSVGGVQTSSSSPFNGTTGVGFGTLANRPITCNTNTAEPGGGVGYFATDVGAQGTLYRCSATNTWTVKYTPYTFPHPLASGIPIPTNIPKSPVIIQVQ